MSANFTAAQGQEELQKGYGKAEELLKNEDKLEKFLQQLEKKLKVIPAVGGTLCNIPVLVSMLKSYLSGEYKNLPVGSLLAIVSALMYFVSPIDVIPDVIPGVGYVDDAFVVAACYKLVESDIKEYQLWREMNRR